MAWGSSNLCYSRGRPIIKCSSNYTVVLTKHSSIYEGTGNISLRFTAGRCGSRTPVPGIWPPVSQMLQSITLTHMLFFPLYLQRPSWKREIRERKWDQSFVIEFVCWGILGKCIHWCIHKHFDPTVLYLSRHCREVSENKCPLCKQGVKEIERVQNLEL